VKPLSKTEYSEGVLSFGNSVLRQQQNAMSTRNKYINE